MLSLTRHRTMPAKTETRKAISTQVMGLAAPQRRNKDRLVRRRIEHAVLLRGDAVRAAALMICGHAALAHKLVEATLGLGEVGFVVGIEREGGVARGVHYDLACHNSFLSYPSILSTWNRFGGSGTTPESAW